MGLDAIYLHVWNLLVIFEQGETIELVFIPKHELSQFIILTSKDTKYQDMVILYIQILDSFRRSISAHLA